MFFASPEKMRTGVQQGREPDAEVLEAPLHQD